MQRRAAAAYVVLFMVISAGAYAYLGMVEQPQVQMDGDSYAEGATITVDAREYSVTDLSDGSGTLAWTNQSAQYEVTLEHNETVSWRTVSWPDQGVQTVTLSAGTTIPYNDTEYAVVVNASAEPPTLRLEQTANRSINETFEQGGTLTLNLTEQFVPGATITEITEDGATLSWAEDYRVAIPNETDPTSMSFVQQQNVTRLLVTDRAVENSLGTYANGTQFVQHRDGNQTLLDEYVPDPEVETRSEGETLEYDGNETTVGNITSDTVPLQWRDVRTTEVTLSDGATVDLNGQTYLVHFPDSASVKLLENTTENYAAYQAEQDEVDSYHERTSGLWAVVISSALAGLLLLSLAYLPVKD